MTKRSDALPRERVEAALSYLRREFQDGVSEHETPSGSLHVIAREGGAEYEVEFSREFLDEHGPAEIIRLLTDWNLAAEMRRVDGLAVAVSTAGIRLDSSN
jgi:hypothetical protein